METLRNARKLGVEYMSEDINKILELTTNEVGEIIIDYIDKNGITKEWKYSSDKEILNYITNLQQENERLNNNWNKLEEWLNIQQNISSPEQILNDIFSKLQELKGSDKE